MQDDERSQRESTPGEAAHPLELAPLPELLTALATSPRGLSNAEAAALKARVGPNRLPARKVHHWRRALRQGTHLMAWLLWVAGALAFMAGTPALGVAIWLVNVINGVFTYLQEYRAERATEALLQLVPRQVVALRDGCELSLDGDELVPGDLIVLAEGDAVPADARLLESSSLAVEESALTGESTPVYKDASLPTAAPEGTSRPDVVYSGTHVTSGAAKAIVFATGPSTRLGEVARLAEVQATRPGPLETELQQVTRVVSALALGIGTSFGLLAVVTGSLPMGEAAVFALGLIVAFVPEGLLPTVTLALSISTQRMARRQAVVKRLSAVEALGACTVICTDKTGTLTQNQMTVREVHLPEAHAVLEGSGFTPHGALRWEERTGTDTQCAAALRELFIDAVLASDARLVAPDAGREWGIVGDPTEAALLVAARKVGLDEETLRERSQRLSEYPFDARRMRMSSLIRRDGRVLVMSKGAPIELLAHCTSERRHGTEHPLDDERRRAWGERIDASAARGHRVLGLAMREATQDDTSLPVDEIERELVFLGFVAMVDPPRPDVHAAITRCERAGIRVVMLTGDHPLAARTIAAELGLVPPGGARVIHGHDLDELSEAELAHALDQPVVFARVLPEQKLRIVSALQRMGHVVAVTGDGVNDAPALKRADIGVAMGRSGTDVARAVADMVLLDDHFATIVHAICEGRAIFENIRRFSSYIFTSNVPEAAPFLLFALSGGQLPLALGVLQILAIDLGTDLMPALALGAEPPHEGIMGQPPRARTEKILTRPALVRALLFLGPLQAVAVLGAFFAHYALAGFVLGTDALPTSGPLHASAAGVALATVVFTQLGNLFAHRDEQHRRLRTLLAGNRWMLVGIASELVLLWLLLYLPPLADLVGVAPFPVGEWVLVSASAPLLLAAERGRCRYRARGKSSRGKRGDNRSPATTLVPHFRADSVRPEALRAGRDGPRAGQDNLDGRTR